MEKAKSKEESRVEHLDQDHNTAQKGTCLMQGKQEELRCTDKTKEEDENCYVRPSDQRDGRKQVHMQGY